MVVEIGAVHPILGSTRRRNLYLAAWVVIGSLGAVAWSAANPGAGVGVALAVVVPPGLVLAFVCLSARYVCRAAPLEAASLVRTLAMHAGAAMVAAAVWAAVWAGWTGVLAGLPAFGDAARLTPARLAAVATAGVLLFWLSSLLHYLLAAFEQSRRAEARELGLKVLAREAELKALRAQIDPHFPLQRPAVDQRADRGRSGRRAAHVPAAGRLLPKQRAARRRGRDPVGG